MASKGKGVARKPSTRTRGTSSRRQASQEAERFDTPVHAERGEILTERKVIHERVINFRGKRDTFQEHILPWGWEFMYDPVIPINMTLVHEFYANRDQKNQCEVIGREGATWPEVPGRISSKTLNKDAWMWRKLIVCNIMPTRHETTLGADHILLIYDLMKGMTVSLPGVMVSAMNEDPTKYKRQLLPFPMFITKWAEEAGIPTYWWDEIFNVPKAQQFFPYGIRKKDEEVERDPAPPAPAPVPPPAARTTRTNTPASSHSSSSQPSRNELMRALRRNERIMRKHEQLHPNIDTSQLQQISSPEVSEQQQQVASDSKEEDSSKEDESDEDSSEE
ncbi:hypothetical protein PIB30_086921 [Stylosanthes scabra]|uniref:Putative plant transposon protein domain-containing protein n=1 Tax=Stylosanthes scabra TaxID=79078 RepID=A0ABU6ZS32_9FABA|nr:hypothetical protein [Stylosanthes scabra]